MGGRRSETATLAEGDVLDVSAEDPKDKTGAQRARGATLPSNHDTGGRTTKGHPLKPTRYPSVPRALRPLPTTTAGLGPVLGSRVGPVGTEDGHRPREGGRVSCPAKLRPRGPNRREVRVECWKRKGSGSISLRSCVYGPD